MTKFNQALLGKWKWNLVHHQGELRARVLDSKYGGWRNQDENITASVASEWWSDLNSICHNSREDSRFNSGIKWSVGPSSKARFWEDGWMADGIPLMVKYPRLHLNSNQKNQCIQQLGSSSGGTWEWRLQWRRLLFEAEIPMGVAFLEEIQDLNINEQQQDRWVWLNDSTGVYTVSSAYQLLDRESRDDNTDGVFQDVWKLKIPSKAVFFAWRLIRDRLPTKSNLSRRNVDITDKLCPFYREKDEEAAHLFFSCHKIMLLWWESSSWINMEGVFLQNPRQHFLQHSCCTTYLGIKSKR